jgi:hypothetical protein
MHGLCAMLGFFAFPRTRIGHAFPATQTKAEKIIFGMLAEW